jgi:hypothetical protein
MKIQITSLNCNDYATGLTGPFYEIMALLGIHWPINVTKRHEWLLMDVRTKRTNKD